MQTEKTSNDFHPIADADYCDEHEWAGYGDCPKCVEEYPDAFQQNGSEK